MVNLILTWFHQESFYVLYFSTFCDTIFSNKREWWWKFIFYSAKGCIFKFSCKCARNGKFQISKMKKWKFSEKNNFFLLDIFVVLWLQCMQKNVFWLLNQHKNPKMYFGAHCTLETPKRDLKSCCSELHVLLQLLKFWLLCVLSNNFNNFFST